MEFPFFKTKTKGKIKRKFDLNNFKERKEYFELKAGLEIEKLKKYLEKNTFVAYLLGKKNSGKGTYAKMFAEIIGSEKIIHFSIGDMIRNIDKELKDKKKKKELIEFLEKNYRGWASIKELINLLEKRSTQNLLPTDLILILVKREINKMEKKTFFIDGFPRDLDQVNFSLFFRDLIGYRDDLDIFILIDVPKNVINERIKYRRVCPSCQTSRNFKLLPTSKIEYDLVKKEFHLLCDNPQCDEDSPRLLPKEGDEKGIDPIKERLKKDEELMTRAFTLYGVSKVLLRNSLPIEVVKKYVDDYEITPEYVFQWNKIKEKVEIREKPWVILDDKEIKSVSLLAPPVVVSLIKQITRLLT
jgi:adenylate kinase family enzyme